MAAFALVQCDAIRSEQLNTDTFHKPTTYEPHVLISFEQKITFARHENGRVGVFRMKMRTLVQKLQPLEKCQFSNCSHLIASHCTMYMYNVMQSDGNSFGGDVVLELSMQGGRQHFIPNICKANIFLNFNYQNLKF